MAGLDEIRERMAEFLRGHGVEAATAWPGRARGRLDGPVAAVSLRGFQGGPGGFRDYLGERYNAGERRWEELYGKRVKLTFGLDLYGAAEDGAQPLRAAFDRMAEALGGDGPAGLKVLELSAGEAEYDREAGLCRCGAEAVCEAYLYAVADEGGAFLDFEVRGARQDGDT